MAGVKKISQIFRVTPRQGERRCQADYSGGRIQLPGKLRPGRKYSRPYVPAESFPPQESPQEGTRQEKENSPEKIWQEGGTFPRMACARPLHLRSRNMPGRGECAEQVHAGKCPSKGKACCGTCRCAGGPREKNLHRPLTSCRSARKARERRKEQQDSSGGNLALPGEQKNFQRLAHGTGKKLAMEKEADQMRRIAPRHRKEKTPCPVLHGRSEGDFPTFRVTPQAGGARCPAEYSRRNIQIPEKLPCRKYGRPHLPAENFPPQESPQDKTGEGKFPSGAVPALLFASSLSARACAHTTESQRPPGRNTNRSTQAGPRYTESRYRPFPQRNMFRPAPSAVHVPSSPGKMPFSDAPQGRLRLFFPACGKRTKKALQEDAVRLKAAGL